MSLFNNHVSLFDESIDPIEYADYIFDEMAMRVGYNNYSNNVNNVYRNNDAAALASKYGNAELANQLSNKASMYSKFNKTQFDPNSGKQQFNNSNIGFNQKGYNRFGHNVGANKLNVYNTQKLAAVKAGIQANAARQRIANKLGISNRYNAVKSGFGSNTFNNNTVQSQANMARQRLRNKYGNI